MCIHSGCSWADVIVVCWLQHWHSYFVHLKYHEIIIQIRRPALNMHKMWMWFLVGKRGALRFWEEKFISETVVLNLWNANVGKWEFLLLCNKTYTDILIAPELQISESWLVREGNAELSTGLPCSQTKPAFSIYFFLMIVLASVMCKVFPL